MKRNLLKIISVAILLLIATIGCKKDHNVTNVTLNPTKITLAVEETATLTATVYPNDAANKVVNWTSSDETVAEVANGFVTAKNVGTTTITVITEDGNYKAECEVRVIPKGVGVVINGVCWATRNVDMPGTFAENPEDAGMFYQWNRKVGWSSTDPMINSEGGTTWDDTPAEGNTWEKVNDPCPAGWRVPTHEEQVSLAEADSQWAMVNGVTGRMFGKAATDDLTFFLPAAGHRHSYSGIVYFEGTDGYYWSRSSSIIDTRAFYLNFGTNVSTNNSFHRAVGFSVRCVAE